MKFINLPEAAQARMEEAYWQTYGRFADLFEAWTLIMADYEFEDFEDMEQPADAVNDPPQETVTEPQANEADTTAPSEDAPTAVDIEHIETVTLTPEEIEAVLSEEATETKKRK
jgi:tRNA A37 threonylcarbamoyladenosine modification protein TsaB